MAKKFKLPALLTKARYGRLKSGRVNPFEVEPCIQLARRGLHAKTIARTLGLTIGQVHRRIKGQQKLRDYRDGNTPEAIDILKKFHIKR